MHPKNIFKPNNQMATVLSTSLSVGNFYLGQKILQAEFW
jgi:hypothetical protein